MDDIAVIIVSWNVKGDLRKCLTSLFQPPTSPVKFGVWVVDNASADSTVDMVRHEFPQVHLIANDTNAGFSRANNQGIVASKDSRYVFLLNSDAYVQSPDTLSKLMEFADSHEKLAIAGAHVLNPNGSLQYSCRRFPGLRAGLFRNTLLGKLFPRNKYTTQYLMGDVDHSKEHMVDWVSGCAMLISRKFIEEHGALDERFFMYCEDVDICRRAWDAGLEVWYCPDAYVTHRIGGSSDKNAEKMIWEFHKSWEIYDLKHNPGASLLRRAAVKLGLWLRATIRIINRRRGERILRQQERVSSPTPQADHGGLPTDSVVK
jgi:GT2 family glycosyltransferase